MVVVAGGTVVVGGHAVVDVELVDEVVDGVEDGGAVAAHGSLVVDVVVVELDVVLDDVDDDAGVGDTAPGEGASPREAADDPVAVGTADGGSPSPP